MWRLQRNLIKWSLRTRALSAASLDALELKLKVFHCVYLLVLKASLRLAMRSHDGWLRGTLDGEPLTTSRRSCFDKRSSRNEAKSETMLTHRMSNSYLKSFIARCIALMNCIVGRAQHDFGNDLLVNAAASLLADAFSWASFNTWANIVNLKTGVPHWSRRCSRISIYWLQHVSWRCKCAEQLSLCLWSTRL